MKTLLKRFLVLLTILALVFSMAACSPSEEPAEEPEQEEPAEEPEEEEPAEADEDVVAEAVNSYFAEMPEDIYKIGQADFIEKVANGEDMFVLDIRQADAYAEGHILGAYNAPWGPAIAENLDKLPTDKTVYVYCYSGQTAGQAVATLNMAGIDAKSVNLGFNFGISKVEGYEDYIETYEYEFGEATTEIDPSIQAALTDYYEGLADVAGTTYANYKISEMDLAKLRDAGDDSIYILSIRQQDAYDAGHIAGADLIPWGPGMEQEFDKLPMDKTIVVYCYSGQTAGQTVAGLRLLGYDAVSLNGGMGVGANAPLGWFNQGYPVHVVEEAATDYFANYESSNIIPSEDVFAKIDAEEDMVVLDIRQPDVYSESHIIGAVNIPWNAEFGQHVESLPMDKPIYLYCYTGQTAGQATAVLRMAGYDVQSVKYGFVLGVSNTEGHEAYLEAEANELPAEAVSEMAPAMKARVVKYFEDMASADIKNNIISSEAANELLEAGDESVYFLSIRQAEDYAKGHIPTAANIPWGKDMHLEFNTIPTDKTVIVNCYSGQTAGQAVAVMRFLGYDAVSLKSGMGTDVTAPSGWANEGFEVVQ
ncbi:MAG: rhodanese-like domain-containing protein [Bacillota bacterium]|nr:rhodanese-like domain-containing protein [Bacillota bacterium]